MKKRTPLMMLMLILPATALAHPGHDVAGFVSGFFHPFSGLDHTLVMLAVGIGIAMRKYSALQIASVFLACMALGTVLGMQGLVSPILESLVLGATLLATLLVAFAVRLPLQAHLLFTASFALLHGIAHGMEISPGGSGVTYAGGLLLATAIIMLAGWTGARVLGMQRRQRLLGAGLAVVAGSLFFV